MGYNTSYEGSLHFVKELTMPQLRKLEGILDEDCYDHEHEWHNPAGVGTIDFAMLSEYEGIMHNGSEKSYDGAEQINIILREMRKTWPDFALTGKLQCTDDYHEKYLIVIGEDGWAHRQEQALISINEDITCPHCQKTFTLKDSE